MAEQNRETAILGGGCFWCLEAVFQKVKGVEEVVSGYSGGYIKNPAYREVTSGRTGHAEVVQIHFNPDAISYEVLLSIFFTIHDPTTLNRQGADVGTQYRSVIFYLSDEQKRTAEKVMAHLEEQKVYENPIVTQLVEEAQFYKAEEYHQNYFRSNPDQPYCRVVIEPKVIKFRNNFAEWMK
ncbi:peptide-methionine (S)-S-oxide reductase MsrA [Natronoflexus pectinivorans]|uniref:Peptide methionine sulfoxide reductase MsrA n=1 Tax=Natronoflexus pectinivorans TaxID=682526 RepID=A0A4R2GN61_9BACT|nr:peptide-methionine (S)-S-oxide reductase MsrA [Natronoflexus pectinivorans]TCO09135.1 peptide-methionine (S)-S-oxide reductase [Natronoflexus pectinivorans]